MNFLHRQFHKIIPPAIPSPYLYGTFGRALKRILTEHASRAKVAVEFGVFHGYTTSLIANALPPGGKLYAYDVNDLPVLAGKVRRKDVEVHLMKKGIYSWLTNPFPFDFMWIDVSATEDQMWIIHQRLKPFLKNSIVLSEGTHRTGNKRIKCIPSEDLCTTPPGIFRLLP